MIHAKGCAGDVVKVWPWQHRCRGPECDRWIGRRWGQRFCCSPCRVRAWRLAKRNANAGVSVSAETRDRTFQP
jgi:hypothetical protein